MQGGKTRPESLECSNLATGLTGVSVKWVAVPEASAQCTDGVQDISGVCRTRQTTLKIKRVAVWTSLGTELLHMGPALEMYPGGGHSIQGTPLPPTEKSPLLNGCREATHAHSCPDQPLSSAPRSMPYTTLLTTNAYFL